MSNLIIEKLLAKTLRTDLPAFVPGDSFYANNGHEGGRHMRLNFSHSQPEQIREGIRRLSVAVKMQLRSNHAIR